MFTSLTDLKALFKFYDIDGSGCICYNEFLAAMGEVQLTPRVKVLVQKAWDETGRHGHHDCTGHDIKAGFKREALLAHFLDQFESTKGGNLDGVITRDQFDCAFKDLQMCVPNEEYCIQKIKETWGVRESAAAAVDKCRVDDIVKMFRQKLMFKSNFNQDEFTLRNLFRNFDLDSNGVLTEVELSGLASKLGLEITGDELVAVFERIDLNGNGRIEFDEFVRLMLEKPFK